MNLQIGIREETYKVTWGYNFNPDISGMLEKKSIDLFALRNQTIAFQVLLFSDSEFSLSVTDTAYFDKKGLMDNIRLKTSLNSENSNIKVSMNIIGFIRDDDGVQKADIILYKESTYVKKRVIQPIWVEFKIPLDAAAGQYKGKVEVFIHNGFSKEQKAGELEFSIEVSDVALPDPKDYSFYLDLWQHSSNISRKHEVALWSDEHFTVLEHYIKSLAGLGQKAITLIASEIPWSGQFCHRDWQYPSDLYEYSMIKVEKDINNNLVCDFTAMDRYIDLCFRYGIDKEIEVFGLLNIWMCPEEGFGGVVENFSDGIRVRYFDSKDSCFKYIDNIYDITTYLKAIENHFVELGLIDKVRVVADEPADTKIFNLRLDFLMSIAPMFKYKAAINHVEFIQEACGSITDFVPNFTEACVGFDKVKELIHKIDGRLYWYVCCEPMFPNTFISSNLLESYSIGWLTQYMGLAGFLRWNYTVWPENPRERLSFRAPVWKAGDTNFVYPANNGTPLLTLRYKALLKGIQAYELIEMLKKCNPEAQSIINKAYKKIFKFGEITEFHPRYGRKIEELISLEYADYMDAIKMITEGIINTRNGNKFH